MRDYSFWDQLILQFDEALGSIPLLSAATRPNPAENLLIQDNVLSKKEKLMQTIQRSLTFRLAYGVTFVPPKIFAYERRASWCVTESYCQTPSEVYGLHAANFVFSFYLWAN